MARKTDRLETRLTPEERQQINRAANLAGLSVSSFMVAAAVEKAEQMITESTVTTVPADYFDRLEAALDEADPVPRLARAAKHARRRSRIR